MISATAVKRPTKDNLPLFEAATLGRICQSVFERIEQAVLSTGADQP